MGAILIAYAVAGLCAAALVLDGRITVRERASGKQVEGVALGVVAAIFTLLWPWLVLWVAFPSEDRTS